MNDEADICTRGHFYGEHEITKCQGRYGPCACTGFNYDSAATVATWCAEEATW